MGNKERLVAEFGEEGYKEIMRAWGSRGGQKKVPKGYSMMKKKDRLKNASKGGKTPRKSPLQ